MNLTDPLEFIRRTIDKGFLYPVVFKPTDGTSCGGVSLVCSQVEIERALNKIKNQSSSGKFIVQEYISGESTSVSILCNKKHVRAVSLNKQTVNLNAPFTDSCYLGSTVPIDHPLKHEAFSAAEQVVKLFSGLCGYVGVDVILTQDKVYVLDLNPRLTTSYVGLTEVAERNLGQALIDATTHEQLSEFSVSGVVCFAKLQTAKFTTEKFHKASNSSAIVSPPFPFTDPSVALLRGCGLNLQEASRRLEEAKKSLRNIMC
jgi:predicted ATP-grasp superfamily ATP-dependent carboligase